MERMTKMRSRDLELDAAPESEPEALSLSPSPAPRVGVNLSSMVVKPSASNGGGSDLDIGYDTDDRRRDSPPPHRRFNSLQGPHPRDFPASGRRRGGYSPLHRRRSPDGFRRNEPQPGLHRRGSPIGLHRRGSSLAFHPRSQRFQNDPGHVQRLGSISPPRRLRVDDEYYETDFRPRGSHSGRGMRGRGGGGRGGRFRDISPTFGRGGGRGRGGRFRYISPTFGRGGGGGGGGKPYMRGFNSSAHAISLSEEEFVHRNDPNLSPREGDWICQNPSCGNLNFARRNYCNNCDKCRYDEPYEYSHSPPLHRSFSPKLPVSPSPIDRGIRRDFNGYRSPPRPRSWDTDDPREFNTSLISPRRGGKFINPVRRARFDSHKDNFKERGRADWPSDGDWERERHGRDTFIYESRVNRRPLSPHDRLIRHTRDRSRSPIGGRLPRVSFVDRSRDISRYDEPYAGKDRGDDLDEVHGRGYRHGDARGRRPHVF